MCTAAVQLVCITLVIAVVYNSNTVQGVSSQRCKFPREWKGRWHQDGIGDVQIKTNSLVRERRLLCAEHRRDYFLVEDRNRECFQCLLMMRRHDNLIQYKQSFCRQGATTLQYLCKQINVEANLFTLVRDPHIPTPCPFHEAYYFNYNDGAFDYCPSALSYAAPCAGATKYTFSFQHCQHAALYNSQDATIECIASWKDGSDLYLYAKFSAPSLQFRCFMYHLYGNTVHLAMSADATCYGLSSYQEGPITMELTKDEFGWPSPSCMFPEWFTSTTWQDLSGRHVYQSDQSQQSIIVSKQKDNKSNVKTELRCMETLQGNDTVMVAASFTTAYCYSKRQCVMLNRKNTALVEIYTGPMVEEVSDCSTDIQDYEEMTLLYNPDASGYQACPFPGRYPVVTATIDCSHGNIEIGCNESHTLAVNCSDDESGGGGSTLSCLQSWQEDHVTYTLVKDAADTTSQLVNCLSFSQTADHLVVSSEVQCNRDVSKLLTDPLTAHVSSNPEHCNVGDMTAYDASGDARSPAVYYQDASSYNHGYSVHVYTTSTPTHTAHYLLVCITSMLCVCLNTWSHR